jgi:hypothetical protein
MTAYDAYDGFSYPLANANRLGRTRNKRAWEIASHASRRVMCWSGWVEVQV